MRSIIAALVAASFAVSAHADWVATNDAGDELRLMNGQCDHADILEQLKPEFHSQFKAAQATIGGQAIMGCWIEIEGEDVFWVLFRDAEGVAFAKEMFRERGI